MATKAKTCSRLALFVVPAMYIAPALSADDAGFYLGARLGSAQYPDNSRLTFAPNLSLSGKTDDDEDLAWSFDVGYRFNRYLAIEAGYVDLGEASSPLTDAAATSAAQFSFAVKGATLAMTGAYPLGNWEPYIKAGVFFSDTRLAFSGATAGTAFGGTVSGNGTDALYGAGVGYDFTDQWQAKLDLTYFSEAGESAAGQADALSLTAGFVLRF